MSEPEITAEGDWLARVVFVSDGLEAQALVLRMHEQAAGKPMGRLRLDTLRLTEPTTYDVVFHALPPLAGRRTKFDIVGAAFAGLKDRSRRDPIGPAHAVGLVVASPDAVRTGLAQLAAHGCKPGVIVLEGATDAAQGAVVASANGIPVVGTTAIENGARVMEPLKALAKPVLSMLRDFAATGRAPKVGSLTSEDAHEESTTATDARRIVETNLADFHLSSPDERWQILLSPIWERAADGRPCRRGLLATPSMRRHYFEGDAAALLRSPRLTEMVEAVLAEPDRDQRLGDVRAFYCDDEAPSRAFEGTWSKELAGLSLVLAEIARRGHAGASVEEVLRGPPSAALRQRIAALEAQMEQQLAAIPVDDMVAAFRRAGLSG